MSDGETPTPITIERVLDVLQRGSIQAEHGMLRWSSNYTYLVSICHEDVTVSAIYKPRKGERPLWDFPDGTLCLRERASFLTSQVLDWQIVPPTVLREGARGLGSFQFFIEHNPEVNYFSFDAALKPQLMRMALFDVLANNTDRKGGHCLLDEQGHVWGIDHGLTFHVQHKLRTVIWDFAGRPIPDDLLADVEALCSALTDAGGAYRKALSELLATAEINAFDARLRRLLRSRKYPVPGSGPNYPWPPV